MHKKGPKSTMRKAAASGKRGKLFCLEHWHWVAVYLVLFDVAAVTFSYFCALWLRFDCQFSVIPEYYLLPWLYFTPIYVIISVVVFWALKLYQSIWRFASFVELERIIFSSAILGVVHSVLITVMLALLPGTPSDVSRMPVTYYIFETAGVRITTASESGMLLACCPIITMCFAALFLRDIHTRKQACFMAVTVAGGLLAAAVGGIQTSGNGLGYLFLLIAMCCEAAYAILSQAIRSFNSAEKTFAMLLAGTVVFTALAVTEQTAAGTLTTYLLLPLHDRKFLTAVLFLSLGCNVTGFLCGNYVLPIIGATKRGACGGFGTVVAILGGVIILKESFLPLQMVATVLILAGAYGVLFSSRPEPAAESGYKISSEGEEKI
jgi:drug/metabolite transporter (DMT)-like permease